MISYPNLSQDLVSDNMKITLIIPAVASSLVSLARADSTPMNATNDTVVFQSGSSINDCGDSNFWNYTSDASPLITDCQRIVSNIAGGGSWTSWTGEWRQLVSYGTCRVSINVPGVGQSILFRVGNQDIMDIINMSIQKFGENGKVGAEGDMNCQADMFLPSVLDTEWVLYHT